MPLVEWHDHYFRGTHAWLGNRHHLDLLSDEHEEVFSCVYPHWPCSRCGKAGTQHCFRCKGAYYCSKDCQEAHWSIHKAFCDMLVSAKEEAKKTKAIPREEADEATATKASDTKKQS